MVQTLDNLRRDGTLSVIEYLERMPDKLITRKQELIDDLKKREGVMAGGAQEKEAAAQEKTQGSEVRYAVGSELDAAKKIAQLPTSVQAKYNDLPVKAQRALITR